MQEISQEVKEYLYSFEERIFDTGSQMMHTPPDSNFYYDYESCTKKICFIRDIDKITLSMVGRAVSQKIQFFNPVHEPLLYLRSKPVQVFLQEIQIFLNLHHLHDLFDAEEVLQWLRHMHPVLQHNVIYGIDTQLLHIE